MNLSDEERKLVEKLRLVEALFAGTTFEGERVAAAEAMRRLGEQLKGFQKKEAPTVHQFSLPDPWTRKLYIALLRRHGLKPFRYPRQRYSTVMVRAPSSFIDKVVWPEFLQLAELLQSHLGQITDRIIREAVHADASEPEESPEEAPKELR